MTANYPPPLSSRFVDHVSFDNFSTPDTPENNAISYTLHSSHTGYSFKKRSRTFMVGIDEHEYSDTALRWMLAELVDDGDEIVAVRVVEPEAKLVDKRSVERGDYKEEAEVVMKRIQNWGVDGKAVSIVLEFAVGKLHTTFQKMIQLYEPAMLIVGTKGRSLGGIQGLMGNRNSFSKWCLQYSPIPVVVVRPGEKRNRKKKKRENDPTRNNYRQILRDAGSEVHECDAEPGGSFARVGGLALEPQQEANAVAAALGLRSSYDHGSMKPITVRKEIVSVQSPWQSEVEDSSDISSDELEAVSGDKLLAYAKGEGAVQAVQRRERLHKMEVDEALALAGRKSSVSSSTTDDDDGDVSGLGQGGSMWVI